MSCSGWRPLRVPCRIIADSMRKFRYRPPWLAHILTLAVRHAPSVRTYSHAGHRHSCARPVGAAGRRLPGGGRRRGDRAAAVARPGPAVGPDRVYLDWPAVSGALSYNVKRSAVPGGPHALLGNVATTYYSDTTPATGATYYYAVTAVDAGGESASFREVAASPGVVVDNLDAARVTVTGSWPASGLTGCYGSDSVYAATTAGASPRTVGVLAYVQGALTDRRATGHGTRQQCISRVPRSPEPPGEFVFE